MRYLPSAPAEDRALLETIGVRNAEELLGGIPDRLRLGRELALPPHASEQEVAWEMGRLSARNARFCAQFLGAGAYDHFVPAAVDAQIGRQEWFTAYTPYQPEISQGTLQHIFEYQTLIADLAGLDVSNASLYDGGTACVEAALMAVRVQKKRRTVLVSRGLHPFYRQVLATAFAPHQELRLVELPLAAGGTEPADLAAALHEDVAAVLVGYPNFLGSVEDLTALGEVAHGRGALLVSVTQEPFALGWLEAPGRAGADMACGEAMSFGNKLNYGGPYLGFLAVRDSHKREIPGRVVGQTVDLEGRTGYVLTLTAREQHIRRDKATSNICSNQGLAALRANIFLQLAGPQGLAGLAELNAAKAQFLRSRLLELPDFEPVFDRPFFNEFVLRYHGDVATLREACLRESLLPGLDLGPWYPELEGCLLWCATELHTRGMIESVVEVAARVPSLNREGA
ncbi:MAG: aminomethyl-transferring glycine dehydrogenase subunit GcvPA [Acidobacteria bacterium]|nr:aminomethyl-transferring glycine dehydrogenase subunit GcvPA [Acidobacteriota bacterium]